ncbi:hypothetical protein O3P69_004883 [Scylla paramamosain]|uniref:Cuticle protein n=1 Tax=Scylla paramamosain TaxID=85552 RepID=A0AAW0UBF1_SCYPA
MIPNTVCPRAQVCVVVAAAVAAPTYNTPIPILKDDRTQNAAGEYSFNFETGNGIVRSESGYQADGQENSGAFSYTSPDGTPVAISFTSGAGGYQPEGAVLPVAPSAALPALRHLRALDAHTHAHAHQQQPCPSTSSPHLSTSSHLSTGFPPSSSFHLSISPPTPLLCLLISLLSTSSTSPSLYSSPSHLSTS